MNYRHIDQVLDENKPVWVRNVHKPRGNVILTLTDRAGHVQKLDIPGVKHPICISDRVTPETIRNSRDLRDLISRRVLELVPPNEAEAYYENNPHAREAVEKAYQNLDWGNPEIRKMREMGNQDDELLYHKQGEALVAGKDPGGPLAPPVALDEVGIQADDEDGDVQARVKVLVAALATREKKAREVRNDLEALDLTDADLTYIVANTDGLVSKYAKQEFAARRGQSLDIIDDSDDE